MLVIGGGKTFEDRVDGLARILKSTTCSGGFAILATIIVVCTLLIRLLLEDIYEAHTLPNGMFCALMDQARTIEKLVEPCAVVALSMRLLDGGDKVLWSVASELS
jgi:hypothetical protein